MTSMWLEAPANRATLIVALADLGEARALSELPQHSSDSCFPPLVGLFPSTSRPQARGLSKVAGMEGPFGGWSHRSTNPRFAQVGDRCDLSSCRGGASFAQVGDRCDLSLYELDELAPYRPTNT